MHVAGVMVDVDFTRAVAEHAGCPVMPSKTGGASRLREPIGIDRARVAPRVLEKRDVALMRDDRRAFGGIRAHAARMVEVMMRVDQVPDRFARNRPLHRVDHGHRSRFGLRRVDDDDVVFHLDGDALGGALDHPDAVGDLLGLERRRCRRPARCRMFAGTSIETAAFGFTSVTVRSRIGYGPLRCMMCVGNFTPPKSL